MFSFSCPTCSAVSNFKREISYNKRVGIGKCSACSTIRPVACSRCNHVFDYIRPHLINDFFKKSCCDKCKLVPDNLLEHFKRGILVTACKCCNKLIPHNTRSKFMNAIRHPKICVKCSVISLRDKISFNLNTIEMSSKSRLTGNSLKSLATKLYWRKSTGRSKKESFTRLKLGFKRWYHHITMTSENRESWLINLRHSFEQYRGDNHWMKQEKNVNHWNKFQYFTKL